MLHAPPMRPRFTLEVPLEADVLLERLLTPEGSPERIEIVRAGRHLEWMIPRPARHFWSPRLSLEVVDRDEGCAVSGLFGPRPSVWTMFAAAYMGIGFVAVTASMFAASQWWIDQSPTALYAVPVCAIAALLLYAFSLFGQRLAHDEMQLFREALLVALAPSGLEDDRPGFVDPDSPERGEAAE